MSALARQESRLVGIVLGQGGDATGFGGPVRADAATGLRVYVEAHGLRLLEALGNDYAGLLRLAGAEEFERLGRAYIAARPSRHANLRWYGGALADFLRRREEWRERRDFADMAAFEWAEGEAFDAADARPLEAEALGRVAPEAWRDLGLVFHPSFRRVDLATDVGGWLAAETKDAPRARASTWIFWRKDLTIFRRIAEPDEAAALDAASAGAGFETVCRRLADFVGEDRAAARAAGLLRVWLDAGLIVGLTGI